MSQVLLAGLANALQELEEIGIQAIEQRIASLSGLLRTAMDRIPGLQRQDLGTPGRQSGLIAFTLKGWDSLALKARLARQGINIGANGVAYTPLDMQARGLASIARIAVSHLNTEGEIQRLLRALEELAEGGPAG